MTGHRLGNDAAQPGEILLGRETYGLVADRVRAATEHELKEQNWLRKTDDFKEGVKATAERRAPCHRRRAPRTVPSTARRRQVATAGADPRGGG